MEQKDYKTHLEPLLYLAESRIRQIIHEEVRRVLCEFENEKKPPHFYNRSEVCSMLDISLPTLWNITKNGFIKSTNVGRRVLYSEEDVKEYLEYGKVKHDAYSLEQRKEKCFQAKKTYIMLDETTNYYKIGISNSPIFREGTLRSEKPSVKLLYICELNVENILHKKYKEYRVRGEWFNLSKDQIQEIVNVYKFKKYTEK